MARLPKKGGSRDSSLVRHNHYSLPFFGEARGKPISKEHHLLPSACSSSNPPPRPPCQTGMERTRLAVPDLLLWSDVCTTRGLWLNSIWAIIVGISNVLQPANSNTHLRSTRGWATVVGTSNTNLSPCVQPTG